jgi:hypothetical protein
MCELQKLILHQAGLQVSYSGSDSSSFTAGTLCVSNLNELRDALKIVTTAERRHVLQSYSVVTSFVRVVLACIVTDTECFHMPTIISSLLWSTMTLSELTELLRSPIPNLTAHVSHWFVAYQSDMTCAATDFSSYENATSFRGIVGHIVHDDDTIMWSEGRLPEYMHNATLNIRFVGHTAVPACYRHVLL